MGLVCVGPVEYRGQDALKADIDNLTAATRNGQQQEVFMPAVAPSGVGRNEYYDSDEAYLFALAEALRTEYQAIVDAGFILQVDDPWLSELYSYSRLPKDECREQGEMYVSAVNHALQGIAPGKVRFHTCYGINEGPRVHDAPLSDLVDLLLMVNAGAYSFESANARHAHEYHVWERLKLPECNLLIPGVITHGSTIVEHPELIAERLVHFARLRRRANGIPRAPRA